MKKTVQEIIKEYKIENNVTVLFIGDIELIAKAYADQETSTLYTRAQMIEFGEKVREKCSDKCHTINDPFKIYEEIQSINIKNLLNK